MSNWKEPISLIRKRLKMTMIFSSTGNEIEHYDLDLLNRAQMWLSQYRPWELLTKDIPLVLVDGLTATLPADCNAVLDIYTTDASGIPLMHFTNSNIDPSISYTIESTFDKATGRVLTIKFPAVANNTSELRLKYSLELPDFEGSETEEYSFFPPNLLLRCAQKMHIEDKGITGDSQQLALNAFNEELRKFEANSQYNNQAMDLSVKDSWGRPLKIQGHSLRGASSGSSYRPFSRSTHPRIY